MNVQDLIDGMGARMQRERAKTQLTLGKLIELLEAMPEDALVPGLRAPHSYRGYYSDLAFEFGDEPRMAIALLAECRAAMGRAYTGYKGGDYVMGELTPLWVASYGCTGEKLMAVLEGGDLETAREEW